MMQLILTVWRWWRSGARRRRLSRSILAAALLQAALCP